MSNLRLVNIFGSSSGSIVEPTSDGRLNVTVRDTTGGAMFQSTNPGITQNSSTPKVSLVDSSTSELFVQANPGIIDFHNPRIDAFGKLRTSISKTLLDSQLQYDSGTQFIWDESISGAGASVTHIPLESAVDITIGTVSGEKIIRQTKRYVRYQPGKSQYVAISAVMGALKSNVRQRIGQFDDYNGLFFEQDGTNLKVVRRTNVTGTPTDNAVNQSSWNLDKLDGTGVSGITLDTSKSNIFTIYYQWLGVGRVIMALDVNSELVPVHEFYNANTLTTTYMGTANLPVRYEIENTGVAASSTTIKQICCAIASESGFSEDRGITYSIDSGTTGTSVPNALYPLLTVKPKLNFRTTELDNRAETFLENLEIFAETVSMHYELYYNASISSTGTYADPSTYATFEYEASSTALSGGVKILSGYVGAGRGQTVTINEAVKNKFPLSNNITNTSGDTLTLAVQPVGGSTLGTAYASLILKEVY